MMVSKNILIITGELKSAKSIQKQLVDLGYHVLGISHTSEEAIGLTEVLQPDLVLVDVNLQEQGGGLVTGEAIRARFDIPSVFLDSHQNGETQHPNLAFESLDFITRPFTARELHKTIQFVIFQHALEQEKRSASQNEPAQLLDATHWISSALMLHARAHLPEEICQPVLENTIRYLNADYGALLWKEGEALITQSLVSNYSVPPTNQIPIADMAGCLCKEAIQKKEIIRSNRQNGRENCSLSGCGLNDYQSLVAVPVLDAEDEVLGLLQFGSKRDMDFGKFSGFLETLAIGIAAVKQNKVLRHQVEQQAIFLSVFMETFIHPLYVLNVDDYSIEFANKAARQAGPENASTCFALTHNRLTPCGEHEHPCPIREIIDTRQPVIVQHIHKSRNGDLRHVQVYGYPVFDEAGDITQILEYVMDITDQVQSEKMLIQSEKLASVGKLAASVAHEIKNPMQSVLGCLGLAQEAVESGNDPQRYFQVARDAVLQVTEIVNRMRELYRPVEEDRLQVDVILLIENVLTLTKKQFLDQGIEVIWQEKGDIELAWMVPDQIHQVILNLMLNALDAMPNGGKLMISATETQDPQGVKIGISDTGGGIANEDLSQVFDPFFTTKEKGSGLGLSVSHEIVKDHGGWIDVDSVLGEGSNFIVWLPVSLRSKELR